MSSPDFLVTIGLEIHAQLKTRTKLFSPDEAQWTGGENDHIHPVSLALPGTLPVVNEQALKMAFKTGKAFGGRIKERSFFARKNYFYPDLPKGYQISQFNEPFCEGGQVWFFLEGEQKSVTLQRIHMEEDAGRSLHRGTDTLVNFNRAGIPLLEIVTEPEITDPFMAGACARAIRRVLRYLDVCDGHLEQGSLRCDCNVSLRPSGETKWGTKVELKNINSFRFIEKALVYEIERQTACLKAGEQIHQETRLYDSTKNQTRPMRSKESASDYRYFPDPDLPPLLFKEKFHSDLPELPFEKVKRFVKDYNLKHSVAESLVEDKNLADYFEKIVKQAGEPQRLSHWFQGELQAHLKEKKQEKCPIPVEDFAQLIIYLSKGEVSNTMAKEIFSEMWETKLKPETIIKNKNLRQISSLSDLEVLVDQILAKYSSQVQDYKNGRTKVFGFFVGQVMKESQGQANPQKLSQVLKRKLDEL